MLLLVSREMADISEQTDTSGKVPLEERTPAEGGDAEGGQDSLDSRFSR